MEKKLILYVEDDSMMHSLLKFILCDICILEVCSSPDEFFEKYMNIPYSLFIMDIGFKNSNTNGIELSQEIKKMKLHKNTPIVAFTAYSMGYIRENVNQAKEMGIFEEILTKPFENLEYFRNTILKYLQ